MGWLKHLEKHGSAAVQARVKGGATLAVGRASWVGMCWFVNVLPRGDTLTTPHSYSIRKLDTRDNPPNNARANVHPHCAAKLISEVCSGRSES